MAHQCIDGDNCKEIEIERESFKFINVYADVVVFSGCCAALFINDARQSPVQQTMGQKRDLFTKQQLLFSYEN